MRRRTFLAIAAGSVAGLAGCTDGDDEGDGLDGPPRLHVDGRWVFDPDDNPVVLRGVSAVDPVTGVENAAERGKDYLDTLRLATDESAGWHGRVLRIPIDPASVRSVGLGQLLEEYVDPAVELAAERGVYALLCYGATGRYDTPSMDRRIRSFWGDVAPRYANDSHVLYELFSDPSEPASGGIEAWRAWKQRASPWVSLVREHAPDTPVVVGSPAWSSMTAHAAREPFPQDDLLYAAHVYPSWDPDGWERAFGTPALDVPVFVTEWGYATDDVGEEYYLRGTTDGWGEPFRTWVDAHENVHWCATTFDSRAQPAIFDADWTPTPDEEGMGTLTKEWLAERSSSHQPGESTPIPTTDDSPPPAPTSFSVEEIGEESVTLRWDAPEIGDGLEILQYRVGVEDHDPDVYRATQRSATIGDLVPGGSYDAQLVAVDAAGQLSETVTVSFETLEPMTPQATIPQASDVPEVQNGTWPDVPDHAIDQYLWGEQIVGGAWWQAVWNDEQLHVLVEIVEPDGTQQDLTVELYLDLDDSSGTSYDGENDLQLLVDRGSETAVSGANSAPVVEGVEVTTSETDSGWWTQLSIPWEQYGVRPIAGHRLGFDAHLLLFEDGQRAGKRSWFDEIDDAWQDPSVFGTVELDI